MTGPDRVGFLHGQSTNDAKKLAVGQSCYAAFLNPKGRMRGAAAISAGFPEDRASRSTHARNILL
ncbi:MAG: hypothetical protein ABSD58_04390 [Verrucomicrobiia bacterium]